VVGGVVGGVVGVVVGGVVVGLVVGVLALALDEADALAEPDALADADLLGRWLCPLGLLCGWVVSGGGMTPKEGSVATLSLGAAVGALVGVPELPDDLSGRRAIASASPPASTIIAITPISSAVWLRGWRRLSEPEVV
jgi:hypothetical protein